jgi:hypothetical protein
MEGRLEISSNAAEIVSRFNKMPAQVQAATLKGLQRGLLLAQNRVRTQTGIRARTGAAGLMGRLTSYARVQGGDVDAAIGFRKHGGFPYELSQEFGAKAKPGKAMAIPMTPKAKRAGSPRNFPGELFIPMSSGVLMEKRARSAVLQYVLVKSIPARLKFRENVLASLPEISREIVDSWKEGVRA